LYIALIEIFFLNRKFLPGLLQEWLFLRIQKVDTEGDEIGKGHGMGRGGREREREREREGVREHSSQGMCLSRSAWVGVGVLKKENNNNPPSPKNSC
jgi:hypothetical protein